MKAAKTAAIGVACLTVCTILFGISATAKQPQTKELKFHGYSVVQVDVWSPTYDWLILEETGEMTHVGQYACEGKGGFGPDGMYGSGTLTTASGDVLRWTANGTKVTLEGLTGRFTGAVGSFQVTRTEKSRETLDSGCPVITYIQSGIGTITY